MAQITLYQDSNFKGRALALTCPESDLNNAGFNDKASSCKVESGTWILYKNSNFGSDYSILGPGEYADAAAMGIANDSLSSLRPLPEDGICLFHNSNYGARMVTLTAAQSNLKNDDFNDETSSVIVRSGKWNLYTDIDFKGTICSLGVGTYETPEVGGFNNDAISSVRPG